MRTHPNATLICIYVTLEHTDVTLIFADVTMVHINRTLIHTDVTMGVTVATRCLKVVTRITATTRTLTRHIYKCDKATDVIITLTSAPCGDTGRTCFC